MSLLARSLTRRVSLLIRGVRAIPTISTAQRKFTPARRYTTSTPVTPPTLGPSEKQPEPRLSLTFTCTVPKCSHRSTHEFSKASYERGIVLVQCPNCKNRHLIADHLGWFRDHDETAGGTLKTVEDLMKAKGEKVKRGRLDAGGVVEYVDE